MNNLFIYLLQSGINLGVLYVLFWLFLRKDSFFTMNRIFLVVSSVFSFILPLIKFTLPFKGLEETGYIFLLDAIVITPDKLANSINNHFNLYQTLTIIYLLGAGIFSLKFIYQLIQIGLLIIKYGIQKSNGLNLVLVDPPYSPFSFFNIVFISNDLLSKDHFSNIITHEKIHIKQKHSIDLIILELLCIIQWFNPIIWFYKKTLKNIHEFLADEGVLTEGYNKRNYQELLLNQVLGTQAIAISNYFNHSLIKRRFIMMSKSKTQKFAYIKMVFILPVALIFTLILSSVVTEKVVAQADTEKTEISKTPVKQEEEVYRVVEKMPSFQGGDKAFYEFLVDNIKYPKEAIKNGITGTVFVTFIVEKNGSVSNVKLLRGIGGGCDEEALRVVSLLPNYNPGIEKGKPVRTEFNIPISFRLDNGAKKNPDKEKKDPPPPPSPPVK